MRSGGFKEHSYIGKVQRRDTEAKSSGGDPENEPRGRSYLHDPHLPRTAKADHSSPRGGTKPTESCPQQEASVMHVYNWSSALQPELKLVTGATFMAPNYRYRKNSFAGATGNSRLRHTFLDSKSLLQMHMFLSGYLLHLGKFNFYNTCYKLL